MSEPTEAEKEATKARMREALDVLQNYTTADGKLDGTKLTKELRRLSAENEALRRERDESAAVHQQEIAEYAEALAESHAKVAELEALLHSTHGQAVVAMMSRAMDAEAALAAERQRVERLREALSKARDMLLRYAHDDEAANGNGYGCYSDPISVVGPFLGVIDAALAQEEAHEQD